MTTADGHDDRKPEGLRSDATPHQPPALVRSLHEQGVDVTGSESAAELSIMQAAVDEFKRAAEALAGRVPPPPFSCGGDDRGRQVVPPRAADETPRQYADRVARMAARFRSLSQMPGRERGTR